MSEQKAFLEKVHIKNFLSLRNVTLPFKPLTVLVGPNASGKSNVLSTLSFIKWVVTHKKLPLVQQIQNSFWEGKATEITFQLGIKVKSTHTDYRLVLNAETENPIEIEELSLNGKNVILINGGEGVVCDENTAKRREYKSKVLALKSNDYPENKTIRNTLIEFINGWSFYDFQPGFIPSYLVGLDSDDRIQFHLFKEEESSDLVKSFSISDAYAKNLNVIFCSTLNKILSSWFKNDIGRFQNVYTSLKKNMNISIECQQKNDNHKLYLLEGNENPIPLDRASSGTLRLIAYYMLLYYPELPPLIAIEEPERNLHPGALNEIANILEQLAERTQVIITTHSSQLLDAFSPDKLSDSLGVLLLRNRSGIGTEVLNLEQIKDKREALDGWIADFGIGSAVFDSELLQDLMEEPV